MGFGRLHKVASDDKDIVEQLHKIVEQVRIHVAEAKVFAFGSLARKELTEESDLDVAVIVPSHLNVEDVKKSVRSVRLSWPWPLDLLFVSEKEFLEKCEIGGVFFNLRQEGVELYPHWKLG